MKKLNLLFAFILVCSFTFSSCSETKKDDKQVKTEHKETKTAADGDKTETAEYQCPMKCEKDKTYVESGSCPKCKMDLKEIASNETDSHSGHDHH